MIHPCASRANQAPKTRNGPNAMVRRRVTRPTAAPLSEATHSATAPSRQSIVPTAAPSTAAALTSPNPIDAGDTRWRASTGSAIVAEAPSDPADRRGGVVRLTEGQARRECDCQDAEGGGHPGVGQAALFDVDDRGRDQHGHGGGAGNGIVPSGRGDGQGKDRECGDPDDHRPSCSRARRVGRPTNGPAATETAPDPESVEPPTALPLPPMTSPPTSCADISARSRGGIPSAPSGTSTMHGQWAVAGGKGNWPTSERSRERASGASGVRGYVGESDRTVHSSSQLRKSYRWCSGESAASASFVLHRGPQAVLVQAEHVHLGLFAAAVGHHGASLLVHVEHQLGRLLERVAEQLLQHVRHVAHQVDRVVPHDDHPRTVRERLVVEVGFADLGRAERGRHGSIVPDARRLEGATALVAGAGRPYDGSIMAVGSRPLVPSRLAPGGVAHGVRRTPTTVIGAYVALTKPRIIELLLITTVPTMVLAQQGWPATWLVVITLVGGTLAAGGANAINMYVDRDIDGLMERTKNRPLVTGRIRPRNALVFALGLEVAAFAVLWTGANLLAAVLALAATAFYVGVYTIWLKRTSRQNIVIGGAAGAVPVLVGWAAVQGSLSWTPVVLFVVMFLWTPPHFWALAIKYADDYRAADVPMLPSVVPFAQAVRQMIVYTVALVISTLVLIPVAELGWIYGVSAVVLGATTASTTPSRWNRSQACSPPPTTRSPDGCTSPAESWA
jgi:heme o synthase